MPGGEFLHPGLPTPPHGGEGWCEEPAPSCSRTQPQTRVPRCLPSTFSSSPAGFAPSLLRLRALKLFLGLNCFWQAGLLLACPSPHRPPQPRHAAPRQPPAAPPPWPQLCQGHGKSERSLRGKSVQMRPSKRVGRDGEGGGNDSWVRASVPEFDVVCKQPCKCSGAASAGTCPAPLRPRAEQGPGRTLSAGGERAEL